ncbi:MAG: hypothetical protein ACRD4Y_03760, partial [Candidatus Acidiferrales bacterium]
PQGAGLAEQLHERLAQQHRNVIAQLEAGTLPLRGKEKSQTESSEEKEESGEGIDVGLQNPKTWLTAGAATLEVELRGRNSTRGIPGAEVEAMLEHGKERIHCSVVQADARGRATLQFPMPAAAADGASLVIRAKLDSLYGELRFRLKMKHAGPVSDTVLK